MIAGLLLVAMALGLGFGGKVILDRDRGEMYDGFASHRRHRLEAAAVDLGNDVEKIGEDLELGAALVSRTAAADVFLRELHAIAAITREYLAIEVRDRDDQVVVRVVAPNSTANALEDARVGFEEAFAAARAAPGEVKTSRISDETDEETAWHRVFARRSPDNQDLVVAILVDMQPLLTKLRLLSDDTSALLVIGAHGRPAPASHPVLADAVRALPTRAGELPAVAALLRAIATRQPATVRLGEDEAGRIGLPSAVAVGVAVPVYVEDGEPWALALVSSTVALRSQERRLVRRVLVGAAFASATVLALSAYFIRNARRAAALEERLRQADRLAHLTEKAEKILDHIPSGVLALGADRRVTAVNRWMADHLGRDVTGVPLRAVFAGAPPDEILRIDGLVEEAIATGAARSLHRVRLAILGDDRDLSLHAVPLERRLADVQVLLVIEDDTAVRRLEERLLHSEKLATAGQLAAGIAHEIGTPLNIARGRAEITVSKLGPDHPQSPAQRIIVEQIDHVSRLITELLDYVRPRPSAVEAIAADKVLSATSELLSGEIAKRKIRLDTEVSPETPPLRADPGQLRQVLVNLAMNSLDACEPGGRVSIRVRPGNGAVVIEVEDDGVGIPTGQHAQVFDPFFTTKKRGQGTGLGLWVVAQLVRSHDAEIELHSEPGAGTLVRLIWPAAEVAS
jgi:two-component system, NtrC family, sensor histidine kinase HydH